MVTLWMIATLIAAAAQTARNAMQQSLTATIGTIGATLVRFLYGFPFALVFLFGTSFVTGVAVPRARVACERMRGGRRCFAAFRRRP